MAVNTNGQEPTSQRVVITGGSRGIGAATAIECAQRGADVIITYRSDADQAKAVCEQVESYGVGAQAIHLDMVDPVSVAAFAEAIAEGGMIDGVVLNAGIWLGGKLEQLDAKEWWQVIETNLLGTYNVVRSTYELMRREPGSSVVFVSSVIGLAGFPGDTAYSSSKGALFSFSRSLAREFASSGVRVNAVAPGFVETDMTAELKPGTLERVLSDIPLGRFAQPNEIAKAIAFLVFDATYMTGSVITIDGGWRK